MGDPNDKLVSDTLSFTDKVEYFFSPVTLLIIDGLTFSDVVGQPVPNQPHDQILFVDQVQVALGSVPVGRIEIGVEDRISFTDSISERVPYSKATADSISISDLLQLTIGISAPISDSLSFLDALAAVVAYLIMNSDSLSFSDAVQVSLGGSGALVESLNDSIALFDSIQINLNPNGNYLFGDAFHFDDQVKVNLESLGTSYLRRYLNDVSSL